MADWPLQGDAQRWETVGALTASSVGTSLTAGGTANTKGSWTQVVAATAFDAGGILVAITAAANIFSDHLIDIGIGAASSEQTVVANVLFCVGGNAQAARHYFFPISISAGTRIAARSQSTVASAVTRASVSLVAGTFKQSSAVQTVETLGAATSDSGGTQLDPGTTAHMKPGWTALASSTTSRIRWLLPVTGNQAQSSARGGGSWLLDIAVGAASSEQPIIQNVAGKYNIGNMLFPEMLPPIPVSIPIGSRVSAQIQGSVTAATVRLIDLVLYGSG